MATKPVNFRLDDVHIALLDKMVEVLQENGVKTNKTDVVQKAIYWFAAENVLGQDTITEIIDENYKSFY